VADATRPEESNRRQHAENHHTTNTSPHHPGTFLVDWLVVATVAQPPHAEHRVFPSADLASRLRD
jgi:hypothetical protein